MSYFRALLIAFAVAVAFCVVWYFVSGERKYLRWAGRLFAVGLAMAVLFFAVLLLDRFVI